ncbi:hypothetical protein [Histidinibacterium aquaticum]|uniref:hypothetical protein n=1 Tax=Histidinibacterium aquaticum TaxID=2613962 RepID=UPI00168A7535|nr:hypothetical protein [Histidinibacterium aquaticum]
MELTEGMRAKLPPEVAEKATHRCMTCGAVYDAAGEVYGFLDSEVLDQSWRVRT